MKIEFLRINERAAFEARRDDELRVHADERVRLLVSTADITAVIESYDRIFKRHCDIFIIINRIAARLRFITGDRAVHERQFRVVVVVNRAPVITRGIAG